MNRDALDACIDLGQLGHNYYGVSMLLNQQNKINAVFHFIIHEDLTLDSTAEPATVEVTAELIQIASRLDYRNFTMVMLRAFFLCYALQELKTPLIYILPTFMTLQT